MLFLSLALIFAATPAPAATPEPDIVSELMDSNAVVAWIGAHPDDEIFVAPLLGHVCPQTLQPRCKILTITSGQTGCCVLTNQTVCNTEAKLKEIRAAEHIQAAGQLKAAPTHWDIVPTGACGMPAPAVPVVKENWKIQRPTLYDDVEAFLQGVNRLILFDPRHGSTCNTEHHAAAEIALEVADGLISPNHIYLAQAIYDEGIHCQGNPPRLHWYGYKPAAPNDPSTYLFDAFQAGSWHYLVSIVDTYRSQFVYPFHVNNLGNATPQQQIVPLLRYTKYQAGDDDYDICPIDCIPASPLPSPPKPSPGTVP